SVVPTHCRNTLFAYTTLFRYSDNGCSLDDEDRSDVREGKGRERAKKKEGERERARERKMKRRKRERMRREMTRDDEDVVMMVYLDRKITRLNSSHVSISYSVL